MAVVSLFLMSGIVGQGCSPPAEQVGVVRSAVTFGATWVSLGPDIILNGQAWDPSHLSNPGPRSRVTGRVSVIAANPANPTQDVWVGAASGGLWRGTPPASPNAPWNPYDPYQLLLDWSPMLESLSPLSIGAIKLASCTATRCSTVWVGTGESSIRRDTYYGSGVAVGRWNTSTLRYDFTTGLGTSLFANGSITGLVVDPTTSYPNEKVLVALSSGVATGPSHGTVTTTPSGSYGIYRSTNSGQTWTLVLTQTGVKATDLEMDPSNPQVLYAGLQSKGFYKSTDGGQTWSAINSGMDAALLTGGATPADWAELAIAPSQTSTLYASLAQCRHPFSFPAVDFCQPAIYQSTNGGASWQQKQAFVGSGALNPADFDKPLTAYSTYMHKLAVHPTDPARLWDTGTMLNYSNDSGSSWTPVGKLHPDHHDVVPFLDGSNLIVYDANDGGFFVGDGFDNWDDGGQWGLQITQLQSLGIAPTMPGFLINGTQDNGTNALVGAAWKHFDDGDSASTFVDVDFPGTAYDVFVKFAGSPRRCTNGLVCGASWPSITNGLNPNDAVAWYPPMAQGGILPNQTKHAVFVASSKLYTSSNQGTNWTTVGSLTPTDNTTVFPDINSKNVITAFAIAPSNPRRAYVGYYNGEIWTSSNMDAVGGGTWSKKKNGQATGYPVSSMAIDPLDEKTVWAAFTGVGGGGSFVNLWRTTNGGSSWTDFSAGISQKHVNSVAVISDGGNFVLAGTDSGVYVRGPSDNQMNLLSTGLPAVSVFSLVVDAANGKVFAGTHGRGVWALDFNLTPLVLPQVDYCLSCNFFGVDPVLGPTTLTLAGWMFQANQPSCTVTLKQGATTCATGTTDGDGATIHTDAKGRLVTDKTGTYMNRPFAWGCLAGRCVGDIGQSACMGAAVTQAVVTCGTRTKTLSIPGPVAQSNPPSAVFMVGPDTLPTHPSYSLTLRARSRSSSGSTQTLCGVTQSFTPSATSTATQVLSSLGQALTADPACIAAGVAAIVTTPNWDPEDPGRDALSLSAPGVTARELFPEIEGKTYGILQVEGHGIPLREQIHAPMITISTPAGAGAAGGSLEITESTILGNCSYVVPTFFGDTAATIANRAAGLFNALTNDGTCRDLQKAHDVVVRAPSSNTANAIFNSADQVRVQSADANVTITIGPSGW